MKLQYKSNKMLNQRRVLQYCITAFLQHCNTATLASAALLLSGCMGVYEGGFECPAGTGVGCKSISEVNDLVNAGEVPKKGASVVATQEPEIWYSPPFIREYAKHKRTHDKVPF